MATDNDRDLDALFDFSQPTPPVIRVTAMDTTIAPGEATIVESGASIPVPVVGGKVVGSAQWAAMTVHMAQVVLDPQYVLRKGWGLMKESREADEEYLLLRESIRQAGGNFEPLLVEPTGRTVTILGEEVPELRVRSGARRYWALVDLEIASVLVRVLPAQMDDAQRLIVSLLQNEMREPLPILDRADIISLLHHQHHMRQHVIAARVGMSQPNVVKYLAASAQSPRIRAYLAKRSLSLDHIYFLSQIEDEAQRELVARYIVQEGLSVEQTRQFRDGLNVPESAGGPTLLFASDGNRVQMQRMVQSVADAAAPVEKPVKEVPYWKRTTPLRANPVRLLNNRRDVRVSGTREHPEVELADLAGPSLVQSLAKKKLTRIDIEAYEEAVLADLEACRRAIDALPDLEADAESEDDEDLDEDVFDGWQRTIS